MDSHRLCFDRAGLIGSGEINSMTYELLDHHPKDSIRHRQPSRHDGLNNISSIVAIQFFRGYRELECIRNFFSFCLVVAGSSAVDFPNIVQNKLDEHRDHFACCILLVNGFCFWVEVIITPESFQQHLFLDAQFLGVQFYKIFDSATMRRHNYIIT